MKAVLVVSVVLVVFYSVCIQEVLDTPALQNYRSILGDCLLPQI